MPLRHRIKRSDGIAFLASRLDRSAMRWLLPWSAVRRIAALMTVWLSCLGTTAAVADLTPATLTKIRAATFEVVIPKPSVDPLTYDRPLPIEQLPFQYRNDHYYSIGTAFALGDNRYVTAAHVFTEYFGGLLGEPALRDASGRVFALDQILRYSYERDFVIFSLKEPPKGSPLPTTRTQALNQRVYAVGNALGTGIVIRDGLFTSSTPEDKAGRWNWLRFSAAASPGNSGGPLLDGSGRIIGVVTMRSPNENLNYALPIDEVLRAPDKVAVADRRPLFQIDIIDTMRWQEMTWHWPLPMSYAKFATEYVLAMQAETDKLKSDLLENQRASLFPKGDGADYLLSFTNSYIYEHNFPRVTARGQDGKWFYANPTTYSKGLLGDNGYVEYGTALNNLILFHLRRPDNVPAATLRDNPKNYMDLLLQVTPMTRDMGGQASRITSLGKAASDETFTDGLGRIWRVTTWVRPYLNEVFTLFSLPVPDGYVAIGRLHEAGAQQYVARKTLEIIADFVDTSYGGTLAQWREFLKDRSSLPPHFAKIDIDFTYGKNFSYTSPGVAFSYDNDLMPVGPNSYFWLGFAFIKGEDGRWNWDVVNRTVRSDIEGKQVMQVIRHARPSETVPDEFKDVWNRKVQRQHPNDGKTFYADNTSMIDVVFDHKSGTTKTSPSFLYTVFLRADGHIPDDEMKTKLRQLTRNLTIEEH